MLPASKDEFPKCLYLDQNKWIDLAKAHYGKPDGKPFRECLKVVRAAVSSGKLVVPFSVVNAIESMIATDSGRRERTAKFIVELSRNHTFAPEDALCWMEIGNAMARLFGRGTIRAVRSDVLRTGVAHMMGMDVRVDAPPLLQGLLASFMNSEQLTMKFLLGSGEQRELIAGSRAGEAGARDVFERDRAEFAGMPVGARRRIELNHLLIDSRRVGSYRRAIDAALHDVGATSTNSWLGLARNRMPSISCRTFLIWTCCLRYGPRGIGTECEQSTTTTFVTWTRCR
jgi:hypothetical protein